MRTFLKTADLVREPILRGVNLYLGFGLGWLLLLYSNMTALIQIFRASESGEHKGGVRPAKPETVRQRDLDLPLLSLEGHKVKAGADVGIL